MLIVNPNLTIDRTIPLERLVPGAVHRTGAAATSLGGKGVNVARVARAHSQRQELIGFLPQVNADELGRLAATEGANLLGVPIPGEVRAASVMIEASGRVSVFNEPGPTVREGDWDRLIEAVRARCTEHRTVVCSGSLPPGSPADAYARVVSLAREAGLRSVVDATGEVLRAALNAMPDVVSPNLAEAESLVTGVLVEDVEPSGDLVAERAARAALGLVELGARSAIVSAGSFGAAFVNGETAHFCRSPEVSVVNPIGAGDSLVGGLVCALEAGLEWTAAVIRAMAVASASCEQPVAGGVNLRRAAELEAGMTAVPIDPSAAEAAAAWGRSR